MHGSNRAARVLLWVTLVFVSLIVAFPYYSEYLL